MLLPNVLRCLAYRRDASRDACAIPTAWAAIPIRPPSNVVMAIRNPSPSLPTLFAKGTRQSSRAIDTVSELRMPNFFSFFATTKPGVPFSTMKVLIPLGPLARSVDAMTRTMSADEPLVIQFFVPFNTYSLPSSTATVRWFDASLPASGSERANAPSFLPDARSLRKRSF